MDRFDPSTSIQVGLCMAIQNLLHLCSQLVFRRLSVVRLGRRNLITHNATTNCGDKRGRIMTSAAGNRRLLMQWVPDFSRKFALNQWDVLLPPGWGRDLRRVSNRNLTPKRPKIYGRRNLDELRAWCIGCGNGSTPTASRPKFVPASRCWGSSPFQPRVLHH